MTASVLNYLVGSRINSLGNEKKGHRTVENFKLE